MKKIKILVLASIVSILFPIYSAIAVNYASGICVVMSENYGNLFYDTTAGAVNINNENYSLDRVQGLSTPKNSSVDIYAYKAEDQKRVTIGTLITDRSSSAGLMQYSMDYNYLNNGVLVAKVTSDQVGIIEIKNYVSGCSDLKPVTSVNTSISINDRIKTTSKLNVRESPAFMGKILATVKLGESGSVIDGPVNGDSYLWFKVKYDSGSMGWSAGGWIEKVSSAQPSSYFIQDDNLPIVGQGSVNNSSQNDLEEIRQIDLTNASGEQLASVLSILESILEQMISVIKK